jgi:2-polyprenyl-3-methyl-5-hydroxy-6-metoxy-1,4-benzoquinol methylase
MTELQPTQVPARTAAQAPHHELRNADNSAGFVLPDIRLMREKNPGLRLLDVGAGSGTISISFAKTLPMGHVTALDLNPDILTRAKAVAEAAGVQNIDFQQGDAKKLPFADETFDVTFCHQILTHITSPEQALREMLRVTKPGGIVAAREGDYETECIWPQLPGLLKFHKFVAATMTGAGGTSTAGRELLSWALKAGAARNQITLSFGTWSYQTMDEKKIWGRLSICRPDSLLFCAVQWLTRASSTRFDESAQSRPYARQGDGIRSNYRE